MVKVQFLVSGQIKEFPPKQADLLVKIRKCRYLEETVPAAEVAAPLVTGVISPPVFDPPPAFEPPVVFEPAPEPVPMEVPALPEPVVAVETEFPAPEFPPLEMEAKAAEPEETSEPEPRQKRQYRRRDMKAEG